MSAIGAFRVGAGVASQLDHHKSCCLDMSSVRGEESEYPKDPCGPNVIVNGSVSRLLRGSSGRLVTGRNPPIPVKPLCW
jgi:hypothetical protein